jgi:DNA polymerase III delta prime subunit
MVKLIFNPKDSYNQKDISQISLSPFKNEELELINDKQTKEGPKSTKEIVGLENCHYVLKDWYNDKEKNNKALIIIGPIGCGKTTLVELFCNEENIHVYNVRYTETIKTKKDLLKELVSFCYYSTNNFFVKQQNNKLIFIDEYQNGQNDVLSITDIQTLLNANKLDKKEKISFFGKNINITVPPILIVSGDSKGSKMNDLKKTNNVYYINEIPIFTLKTWIKGIYKNILPDEELVKLISGCKSDKRLLLSNLSCKNLSFYKDIEQNSFDVIGKLFDNIEPLDINEIYKIYETDGFTLCNLVHENYLDYSNDIHVIADCSESISYGEIIFSDTFESSRVFVPEAHCTNAIYIPSVLLKTDKPNKNIRTSCINNRYNIFLNNKKLVDRIGLGITDILHLKKIINHEFVKTKTFSKNQEDFIKNVLGSLKNNTEILELIYKHFSEFKETSVVKTKNFTLKFKEKLKVLNGTT